jgi:hypothetical protein
LAKREAEGSSEFIRGSGRFELTAVGDLNTYALFADHFLRLATKRGRSGIIVPTGIATDSSTKVFFEHINRELLLVSLVSFENESLIFEGVHHAYKFCLLVTQGEPLPGRTPSYVFYIRNMKQLEEGDRFFSLTYDEIALLNPDTLTCPAFRTAEDARLAKKVYARVPIFKSEDPSRIDSEWKPFYIRLIDLGDHAASLEMACFTTQDLQNLVGVYESKLFSFYDPFYASFRNASPINVQKGLPVKIDPDAKLSAPQGNLFRYYCDPDLARQLITKYELANDKYYLVWRDVARNVDERTCIPCIIPGRYLSTRSSPGLGIEYPTTERQLILLGNLSSLVLDYFARQKVVGAHLNWGLLKQLPVVPYVNYSSNAIDYLLGRIADLLCFNTAYQQITEELGQPICADFNPVKRLLLRAELDAFYAHLYGLNRDELRYILDPADVMGPDYPSETFRVLKNNEIRQFGEYRTQRLVLEAWDRLENGELI